MKIKHEYMRIYAGFEIPTAEVINVAIFLDIALSRL
jgi:hypothetical protein